MKSYFKLFAVCLIGFGVSLLFKSMLLSANYVNLSNDPLNAPISKALINSQYPNYIPVEGKDYSVTNVQFFYSKTWAVANIQSVGSGDSGIIVLRENNEVYHSILGPSNYFPQKTLSGLPNQIVKYIRGK